MYGLRYFSGDQEIRLAEISGGGRVRVSSLGHKWWTKPTGRQWEVFEIEGPSDGVGFATGRTYASREDAEEAAKLLGAAHQ